MILIRARNAGCEGVRDRSRHIAAQLHIIEIAIAGRQLAGVREAGCHAVDQDRATSGILPIKSALWPFQDFDLLDIGQIDQRCDLLRLVDSVDIHRDVRIFAQIRSG